MTRQLAAILVADIVGFSRLMEADEAKTLRQYYRLRDDILIPTITRHNGTTRRRAGDGVLAIFPSAIEAMDAALAIQAANKTGDLALRIGLHLGDVVTEGDTVHGHGVNLAVRIEGESPSGGIAMSQAVRDAVRDRVRPIVFMGRRRLKNIRDPVPIYGVGLGDMWWSPRKKILAVGASVVFALIMGVVILTSLTNRSPDRAIAMSDRPTLAVFPFRSISDQTANPAAGRDLALAVVTGLSGLDGINVLAADTSFQNADAGGDRDRMRDTFGARYLITGNFWQEPNVFRLLIEIVDLWNGQSIWTREFRGYDQDLAPIEHDLVTAMTTLIAPIKNGDGVLRASELLRVRAVPDTELRPFDYLLMGNSLVEAGDFSGARAQYRSALAQAPEFALAEARIAATYLAEYWERPEEKDAVTRAAQAAERAMALDPNIAEGHRNLGAARVLSGLNDLGLRSLRQAAEFEGTPDNQIWLAWGLATSGQGEKAREQIEAAFARNPFPPTLYHETRAWVAYLDSDCGTVVKTLRPVQPKSIKTTVFLAACFAENGEVEDALAYAGQIKRLQPNIGVTTIADKLWFPNKSRRAEFLSALRVAGIHDALLSSPRQIGATSP